jgi:outer membrane protein assembly factor BamB
MMMKRITLLALVAGIALAGCAEQRAAIRETVDSAFSDKSENESTIKKAAEPRQLDKEFKPSIALEEIWSGRYGKGYEKLYLKLLPAMDGDNVYVADRDGRIICLDATTGKTKWEDRDKRRPVSGGPGVGDGKVFVGTSNAQVVARDAADGKKLWIAEVSSEILAPPVAARGTVVIRSGDGKLYALDSNTGRLKWTLDRSIPILTLRGTAPPIIHEDMVLAGFDNGRLTALELSTGKELWETRLADPSGRTDLERLVDVDAKPVVRDNTAYIASFQGKVAAVALSDGSLEWTREMSSSEDLDVDADNVYVTDERGTVLALSRQDGSTVWRQKAFRNRKVTGPTRYENFVVVGDFEGYMHWLDVKTGDVVGRERIDKKRIITPPIEIGGALAGYSSTGELSAWRVK